MAVMGFRDRMAEQKAAEDKQREQAAAHKERRKEHKTALAGDPENYEPDATRAVDYLRRASGGMRVNQLDTSKLLAFGTLEALLAVRSELAAIRELLEQRD